MRGLGQPGPRNQSLHHVVTWHVWDFEPDLPFTTWTLVTMRARLIWATNIEITVGQVCGRKKPLFSETELRSTEKLTGAAEIDGFYRIPLQRGSVVKMKIIFD